MPAVEPGRAEGVLAAAYRQCESITKIFAKTFYLGTRLMNEDQKKAVWAIYVWCRRTDDLVDRFVLLPPARRSGIL